MSRVFALLIVVLVWAAIYLPGLGSLEIKGEEGRRILPAVTMLDTAQSARSSSDALRSYIVPYVGSEPYFTKPPLVNWLVALSFKTFGVRNEWTARLPSALAVLLVALAFVTVARPPLGANGSLVAALAWLTNFGLIEKGRLIEIEALYVALTGLAFICWLSWHQQGISSWLTWIVPWIFLGLGWLAKGPLHLVFFYAVVLVVLYQRRQLRELLKPAHFVGILFMLAIFATWAIPCLNMMHDGQVTHVWSRQFSGRVSGEGFRFGSWIMNIPRSLAYFLPWLLFFAFAGRVEFVDERERRTVRGLAWGIILPLVCVDLLPGALPRYTMPLLVPACWLLSMIMCAERHDLPAALNLRRPASLAPSLRLPGLIAALVAVAMLLYAIAIIPQLQRRQKVRTIAQQIDAVAAGNATVYAVNPDYQPYLFYVRAPIIYASKVDDVPRDAQFVLGQPDNISAIESADRWSPRRAHAVLPIKDYRGRKTTLYAIE